MSRPISAKRCLRKRAPQAARLRGRVLVDVVTVTE